MSNEQGERVSWGNIVYFVIFFYEIVIYHLDSVQAKKLLRELLEKYQKWPESEKFFDS